MTDPPARSLDMILPELDEQIDVGPGIEVESWRLAVPGRAGCYLLESGDGEPVLLATVANLRAALVRRLSEPTEDEPTRRVDYRAIVRRVRWRRVFSRFEGNWTYLENARDLLPKTYKRMIKPWRVHWVGVDPSACHPCFTSRNRPFGPPETCFGPFPTAQAARRHIEMLEDLFDLCRYHHILVQAPDGEACAYKEMGRCPAPCDGSVSMEDYEGQIRRAIDFLVQPRGPWVDRWTERMKRAAAELDFERAGRCKAMLDRAKVADAPAAAHAAPLTRFACLVLQPGSRKGRVRAFAVGPGTIRLVDEIEPKRMEEQLDRLAGVARELHDSAVGEIDEPAAERIGLAGWHLLGGKREQGLFLSAAEATDPTRLTEAVEAFQRSKPET